MKQEKARVIDCRFSSNGLQLLLGILVATGVAIAGYVMAPSDKWVGATLGGVAGFIVGVFVGGIVLVFLPPARTPKAISLRALRRLRWNIQFAALAYVLGVVLAPVHVAGFAVLGIAGGYLIVCIAWTSDAACPHCGKFFGYHGILKVEARRCAECGSPFVRADANHTSLD